MDHMRAFARSRRSAMDTVDQWGSASADWSATTRVEMKGPLWALMSSECWKDAMSVTLTAEMSERQWSASNSDLLKASELAQTMDSLSEWTSSGC